MEWAAFLLASQFRSVRGTRGTCLLTFADADEVGFASRMDLRKAVRRAGRARYRMGGRRGIQVTFWTVGACASGRCIRLGILLAEPA
jgi:hypothetical protein